MTNYSPNKNIFKKLDFKFLIYFCVNDCVGNKMTAENKIRNHQKTKTK